MPTQEQQHEKLEALVDDFAAAMKEKLFAKCHDGRKGWDERRFVDTGECSVELLEHVLRHPSMYGYEQEIDIANLAMFLRYHRQKKPIDEAVLTT